MVTLLAVVICGLSTLPRHAVCSQLGRKSELLEFPTVGIPQQVTPMNFLTKEQQQVLAVILLLLLTGIAVRTWRIAHPPATLTGKSPAQQQKP
ncbi:MAG TPA: hypothetical protein VK530_18315 [Candidatus Acidoferrum sp.]|nr:hypothetical protein [Candidatus Acidoferrum sp.]